MNVVKVGDLLNDLPTPSLVLEMSLLERFFTERNLNCSVNEFLANPIHYLTKMQPDDNDDSINHKNDNIDNHLDFRALYVHTRVTSTAAESSPQGAKISYSIGQTPPLDQSEGTLESLSSFSSSRFICTVDTPWNCLAQERQQQQQEETAVQHEQLGAYLGLGLANHHVGGYYWARSMGIGASLPAHGIAFGPSSILSSFNNSNNNISKASHPAHSDPKREGGIIYWKKQGPGQNPAETTEESSNSNDGKRSEWVDFLEVDDTIQLVPYHPLEILTSDQQHCPSNDCCSFLQTLIGVQRIGRPLGADPIVEQIWVKQPQEQQPVLSGDHEENKDDNDKSNCGWLPI